MRLKSVNHKTTLAFSIVLALCSLTHTALSMDADSTNSTKAPESNLYSSDSSAACIASSASKALVSLTNDSRSKARKCGRKRQSKAPPLEADCALQTLAENHAKDMFQMGKLSHQSSSGATLSERADSLKITWQALAENVAVGYKIADKTHQGWLDSPAHCLNIMSPNYKQMGVGEYEGYWAVIFANK